MLLLIVSIVRGVTRSLLREVADVIYHLSYISGYRSLSLSLSLSLSGDKLRESTQFDIVYSNDDDNDNNIYIYIYIYDHTGGFSLTSSHSSYSIPRDLL